MKRRRRAAAYESSQDEEEEKSSSNDDDDQVTCVVKQRPPLTHYVGTGDNRLRVSRLLNDNAALRNCKSLARTLRKQSQGPLFGADIAGRATVTPEHSRQQLFFALCCLTTRLVTGPQLEMALTKASIGWKTNWSICSAQVSMLQAPHLSSTSTPS